MKWWPAELKPGAVIRIKIGNIFHYGIYVSDEEVIQFGMPPFNGISSVTDSSIKVCSSTIKEFSGGHYIESAVYTKTELKKKFSDEQIVLRARENLGQTGYNIIHNNCEHFVYKIVFGSSNSEQENTAKLFWKNRHILDVYLMKIPEKNLDDALLNTFQKERLHEINNIKDSSLKKQKEYSWYLLSKAAENSFGINPDRIKFKKNKFGKWSCRDFYFSISHSGEFVCLALSNKPVGIDMESVSGFKNKFSQNKTLELLQKKLMHKNEMPLSEPVSECTEDTGKNLFLLWQKKESAFKCYGKRKFIPSKIDTTAYTFKELSPSMNKDLNIVLTSTDLTAIRYFILNDKIPERTMEYFNGMS